jgi:hypothetical protein
LKIALGILLAVAGILVLGAVVGCALLTFGVLSLGRANDPSTVAAGLPDPDRAFLTGTSHGATVFIWNCYEGKHIVVYHYSAELYAEPYKREEAGCGELTPIETSLADEQKRELDPRELWRR